MSKRSYTFPIIFLIAGLFFSSCLNSDDDNEIDEEWKQFNESEFHKTQDDPDFTRLNSTSNEGYIYWKESSVITDSDKELRISDNGNPLFTDSIVCRYEGWFFTKEGEKIIFDSTENPIYGSSVNPNKIEKKYAVADMIEGFRTALQNMKAGDEREIVIPWFMAYGTSTKGIIPAFTTLWFDIKIIRVIEMKGKK